jgi:hypothetical protein
MRPIYKLLAILFALTGCSAPDPTHSGDIELGISSPTQLVVQNLPLGNMGQQGPGTDVDDIVSVVVIIDEIDAEVDGVPGKQPVFIGPKAVDLMKLDNTTFASLGITKFPVGHIHELELKLDEIGDYVQLKNGDKHPLEIPVSDIIEVECGLDVQPCGAGTIILDFDPKLKTEDEGTQRREYEILPQVKIKTAKMSGSCGGGGGPDGGTLGKDGGSADMSGPSPDMTQSCPVCAPNEICQNFTCVPNPCNGVVCAPGEFCSVTDGLCHTIMTCTGVVCAPGQTCVNGLCQ